MITITTIPLEDAQARLPELVALLAGGKEIMITQNQKPVAKLVGQISEIRKPRKAGSAKGKLFILQEDKEHLSDFRATKKGQ